MGHPRTFGLAVWSGVSGNMGRPHRHQDLEINYVLAGRMVYLIGGDTVVFEPRRFGVIWAAAPHQAIPQAAPAKLIWATVPLTAALLDRWPEPFSQRLLERGVALDHRPRPGDLPLLRQWERDLRAPSVARRQLVQQEIDARLCRMALDFSDDDAASGEQEIHTGSALATVQRMAAFIAGHYHEPVDVARIAREAHLHPNYAMQLFRRHTDMTINQFLTRQRIAHAQRLLATTRQSILDVALDSGFGSPSRFFQAFRDHVGCTPRDFRQQLHGRGPKE